MYAHRLYAGAAALAVAVGLTAGCSGADPNPTADRGGTAQADHALAVVVGAHANGPRPELVTGARAVIDSAIADGSQASIVVNDGRPVLKGTVSLEVQGKNADARRSYGDRLTVGFTKRITDARAATPESDLLGSITLAARTLSGSGANDRTLLVIDNGLQTVAPLRFQDAGVLNADPGDVADALVSSNALPKLVGAKVVLSGLGDTTAPQQILTTAQRRNLVEIWTTVLQRAGAEVTINDQPLTGPAPEGVPAVTQVPVPEAVSFAAVTTNGLMSFNLGQETVAFLPDQAIYRDPNAVQAVLRPLAEKIVAARLLITLTGTTAGLSDGRALSLRRAETVKKTLVDLGVDPQAVTCIGAGSKWPGHVPDTDVNGNLLPGPAAQNRKVIVEARQG